MSREATNAAQDKTALSAEQAEKILKADMANMVKKVANGRTLSATERGLLQTIAGESGPQDGGVPVEWVKNQVELAKLFNVDRKTIQRWRKEQGFPKAAPDGRWNVPAIRQWLMSMGRVSGEDEGSLKARNLLLQNQRLELRIAILRRDYLPCVDVERWGGELATQIRKVVTQIHLAAPNVVGVSVPEAETRLKEVEDEILTQLHTLDERFASWQADEPVAAGL